MPLKLASASPRAARDRQVSSRLEISACWRLGQLPLFGASVEIAENPGGRRKTGGPGWVLQSRGHGCEIGGCEIGANANPVWG